MQRDPVAIDTSIVVCTCSRAHLLRGALESLLNQDWATTHAVELVVVDDGSTDGTPQLLAELSAPASIPLRVVSGPQAGIAAARNLGFSEARGQWIASFDDDQIAPAGWLRALRKRADDAGAVCVGGALTLAYSSGRPVPLPGPRVRSILGEHLPYGAPQPYSAASQPATNNALLRRDVFFAIGGFQVGFTEGGEDKDLFTRVRAAGHPLWFEPAAAASHITPRNRLAVNNLRWTSLRLGVSDARLALGSGLPAITRLVLTRLLATVVRDLPSLLVADPSKRLDVRCSLWYTQGFLRGVPALRHPGGSGSAFLRSLNFRSRNGERPTLSSATPL